MVLGTSVVGLLMILGGVPPGHVPVPHQRAGIPNHILIDHTLATVATGFRAVPNRAPVSTWNLAAHQDFFRNFDLWESVCAKLTEAIPGVQQQIVQMQEKVDQEAVTSGEWNVSALADETIHKSRAPVLSVLKGTHTLSNGSAVPIAVVYRQGDDMDELTAFYCDHLFLEVENCTVLVKANLLSRIDREEAEAEEKEALQSFASGEPLVRRVGVLSTTEQVREGAAHSHRPLPTPSTH
jgi:hypothetical protein